MADSPQDWGAIPADQLPSSWGAVALEETPEQVVAPKDHRIKVSPSYPYDENWKKAKPGDTVAIASDDLSQWYEATKLDDSHASKVEKVNKFTWNGERVGKGSREDVSDIWGTPAARGPAFSTEHVLAKAGLSAPASAAFLTTMGATANATEGLKAAGPLGKVAATVAPVLAGAVAAGAESYLQRKLTEAVAPSVNRYEESFTPAESAIGGALGSGFKPGLPTSNLRAEAMSRLVPAAAGVGIQTGLEAVGGFQEGAGARIAESGLTNLILNKSTAPAESLMGIGAKAGASIATKVDSILGRKGDIRSTSTQANSEIALDEGAFDNRPLGLKSNIKRPLEGMVAPKPAEPAVDIEGFKKTIADRGEAIVDAITKYADKKYYREANADFLNNLKELGLNAEESARVFEAAEAAKDHFTNYAGAETKKSDLTLGELIGQEVEFEGVKGKLIKEEGGGFGLVPKGAGAIIEVTGPGIGVNEKANIVGVSSAGNRGSIRIPGESKRPFEPTIEYLGKKHLVAEGVGEPVDQWQVKLPGESRGRTLTEAEMKKEGFPLNKTRGSVNPAVMQNLAAPVIGAGVGYQFGDTPEEKRRNAVLGALLASGGVLSKNLAQTLAKKNPAFLDRINRLAVEARAEGKTTWDNYITGMKDSPVTEAQSLETNLQTPPGELAEAQDAPSGDTASPSPRYQWTPFLSKTVGGRALKKIFGTIEGNIFPVSPRIGGAVREYSGLIDQFKVKWTEGTYGLGKAVRKALTPQEVQEFDYQLQFGSHEAAREMLASKSEDLAALLDKAKATYDEMAAAEEAVGRTINRIDDAWPRQMLDYAKFRKAMGRAELGALDAALVAAKKAKGKKLTELEEAEVLNDAVSLALRGKPSFLKSRTIKELTQGEFLDHYEPFDVAMDNRIARVSRDVAKRKFLGKESPEDVDQWDEETGDFGTILQEERAKGNLSPEGQKVIVENLKDFLRQDVAAGNGIAEIGNKISRAQNILFLGDISTSIAQFGDIFVNMRRYGAISALRGLKEGLKNNPKVSLKDLGLGGDTFAETQNLSRAESNQGASGAARRTRDFIIQKMVGWADKVNKQSTVNAARIEFSKVLRDPYSKDYVRLHEKYSERFPERWPDILRDLKSREFEQGKLTDNTRFFLFNELADIQPVSMAQRAQLENASAGTRFLYSLKRYWIKQLDLLRQEGYEKMKNRATWGQGFKNIGTYLAVVSAMQGLAIATIRDIMFGREVDLEENSLQGVFQTFGVSKYMLDNIREGGAGKAAMNFISPMASVVDDTTRDYASFVNNPVEDFPGNSRLLKYLPVAGREAYYWAGAGAEASEKAEKKAQKARDAGELTPSLSSLEKLFLPPEPKKKR